MLARCRARGFAAERILEPTCGSGSFLRAAATAYPAATELVGIEFQRERYGAPLDALAGGEARLRIQYANAYALDFGALRWRGAGPLLVVGNPPWVTAAALGRCATALQPPRSNFKGLRGLAARTGAANFDVAEFLILKLLRELRGASLTLAMLVKESVARHVLRAATALDLGIASAEIVRVDARAWFGVAVDACCLLVSAERHGRLCAAVGLGASLTAPPVASFVPSAPAARLAGPLGFRQGIKHDAAAVFELRRDNGRWRNGFAETVDVEDDYVYPLRKARALHHAEAAPTALIVTQRRLGAPTNVLETQAPRLWRYLLRHRARIAARKSSIYRNAPEFAFFGIGAYSFAPWKVAVAGLYSEPRFRLVGQHGGRPVVLGDTSYFVPFEREGDARAFAALCASPAVATHLREHLVRGKRPITKALLDSIDWATLATTLDPLPDRLPALLGEASAL